MDDQFNLRSPEASEIESQANFFATYYFVHQATSVAGGIPLLDAAGSALGPTLSEEDFCQAALEGTVHIEGYGTFNYTSSARGPAQANCRRFYPRLSGSTISGMNRSRFHRIAGAYGEGTHNYKLVPFRSIAVDRDVIPIGTLVYVPAARGVAISLPSGTQVHHDGYFFACDVGGDIIGRHIDVFLGITDHNPFAFVTSDPHRTFGLETVNNPEIQSFLAQLHS